MDLSGSHILYATYCTVISSKMKDNTNTYYMDLSESQTVYVLDYLLYVQCWLWNLGRQTLPFASPDIISQQMQVRTRTMTMCGKNLRHCRGHKISTHSILERLGILPLTWSSTHDSCAFYTVLLQDYPPWFVWIIIIIYVWDENCRWYQISNSKRGCIIW